MDQPAVRRSAPIRLPSLARPLAGFVAVRGCSADYGGVAPFSFSPGWFPMLTESQLLDVVLSAVLKVPTSVPFNVVALHGLPLLVLWDCRPEANESIAHTVASQWGEVIATSLKHFDIDGRQAVGLMIRGREGKTPSTLAGNLLLSYTMATTEDDAGSQPDPF